MSDVMPEPLEDEDIAQAGKDAIEHFGIKGMHWGRRKNREESDDASGTSDGTLIPDYIIREGNPKRSHGFAKAVGITIAGAAVIAIGATLAGAYVSKNSSVPVSSLKLTRPPGLKKPLVFNPSGKKVRIPKFRNVKMPKRKPKWETVSEGFTTLKDGQQYASYTMSTMGNRSMSDIRGTALAVRG